MSVSDQIMNELRQAFQEYVKVSHPKRTVTRQWRERDDYSKQDRDNGIHALLYRGEMPTDNPCMGIVRVLFLGLIRVHSRSGNGLELEQKELEMLEQLKGFSQTNEGALLHVNNIVTSLQVECPEGWYMAECEYGPVDLTIEPNRWDDGRQFTGDIYIGCAPEIGADHQDDYTKLSINEEGLEDEDA
ncbi:MAG: hypothetical protein ACR2PX_00985 [Endozoicomonas sp.]|uniref:hypothetical protein n=1 Tax=Endozoicomonas sp. TaxID=1892382 RepID=UPI003D9BD19D